MDQHQASDQREDSVQPRHPGYKVDLCLAPIIVQCGVDVLNSRMLIKKVNSTFESMDKARGLMTDWNERLSKTVRDILLNEETQEFLRDLFTSSDDENIITLLGKFTELTRVTFLSNNNAHYLNNFNHYFINLTPFSALSCPPLKL